MIIARELQKRLDLFQQDFVFTYQDLNMPIEWSGSVIKGLNRLVLKGSIAKVSKGRFYKPKQSIFGQLKPRQEELIKDLIMKNGEFVGYITGYSIFNQLGLTTQVPHNIQIGTNVRRNKMQRGVFLIEFVTQPNKITRENIVLLQILDAIRFIKYIPDTNVNVSCRRLIEIIRKMNNDDIDRMISLAGKYTPMVRALLGAMIDNLFGYDKAYTLRMSLNPVTTYKIGISTKELPEITKWQII